MKIQQTNQISKKSLKDLNIDAMTNENTGHPEEQADISMKDMLVYSGIVEQEQNIKKIKDDAADAGKPKPMDDDSAMVLYDKNLQQQASTQLDSGASTVESQENIENDENKKQESVQQNQNSPKSDNVPTDMQISVNENKQESKEIKSNTNKWAHVGQSKINQIAEKDDEEQPVYENMSQAEYDKLFHEATVQAGQELDKPFEELQKEDLAKKKQEIEDQKKKEAEEQAEKKDVLDKQDVQTGKIEENEFDAQRLGNVPRDTAIAYTDQAADKGQEFGTAATKSMAKAEPPVKKEKPKVVETKKTFYEQLLDQELKKDPNALADLAKPVDLVQIGETQKKSKEEVKTLEEQLWERNNPETAQELVMKNASSQKYKEAKELKEKQENSLAGILAQAGVSDENTQI